MPFPTLKVIAVGQRGYPPAAMTRGVINGKVPPLSNSAVASPTLFYSDSPEAIRQGPLTAKSRFKCIKIPVRPPPAPPPPPIVDVTLGFPQDGILFAGRSVSQPAVTHIRAFVYHLNQTSRSVNLMAVLLNKGKAWSSVKVAYYR